MHLSHRASLATPGGELTGSTNRVLGHAGHRGGAPLSSGFRQHDHRPGQAGMVLSSHLQGDKASLTDYTPQGYGQPTQGPRLVSTGHVARATSGPHPSPHADQPPAAP